MRAALRTLGALAALGCGAPGPEPLAADAAFVAERLGAGDLEVEWAGSGWSDAVLRVRRRGELLFASPPGRSFVAAGRGEARVREVRGSFFFRDRELRRCARQGVDATELRAGRVVVRGRLHCAGGSEPYRLAFEAAEGDALRFVLWVGDGDLNRAELALASDADERIFGGGVQFSHFDLKGRRLPVWVREQGVGRGRQPLSWLVDRIAESAGAWHTSYAPVPHLMTSRLRSLAVENSEYAVLDLRDPKRIRVEVWADVLAGRLVRAATPLELLRTYSAWAGRMRPLPDWVHAGAVVGLQGGSARVREALAELESLDTPIAAFWLQDWVGRRDTSFGQQLWWSWRLDRERYPEWEALLAELAERGIRVMTYLNPFLVEKPGAARDLLDEARRRGFLVERPDGGPYFTTITDFDAVLVDLTDPEARDWLGAVIAEELIGSGASGWMADFGEALPWDAVLHEGRAPVVHNRYPELWARLNRRAIDAAGRGEDVVFFARSGFTHSPRYASLFWLGDQLVSWDEHDGIKSAVTGLLSGGLSGFAFNHADVGGYTTIETPLYSIRRSKELLLRWIELGAFQVVFRSHEGSRPDANHQFDSDPETLRHFSRFAKVHAAWGSYRSELIREAAASGAPVLRHPWLLYPEEPWTRSVRHEQFFVGSELLVAPVLDPGRDAVTLWLPPGRWEHLWSGRLLGDPGASRRVQVTAPLGRPAVFFREGSAVGARFRQELARWGVLEGEPDHLARGLRPAEE